MSEWDELAADWNDRPGVRAYADAAHRSLVEHAAQVAFDLHQVRVCDFGCGTGLLTERLADVATHIDAIDTSPAMLGVLARTAERSGWDHVRPSTQLPGESERYDLIVCSSVLAFVDDYDATVEMLAQHLGHGGWFVQWDWERNLPADDQSIGFSVADIRSALGAAGLEHVDVRHGFEIEVDGETLRPLMGTGRRPT